MKLSRQQRSLALSHDNANKREEARLKLHISKTQREMEAIQRRLQAWDEKEEQEKLTQSLETQHNTEKEKKKGRLGPESWKLRGAARPASQVYSFDTRYVCPHAADLAEAAEKTKRLQNIFDLHRGQFGRWEDDTVSPLVSQTCREYLTLLMRFGLLNLEAKRFKIAKETFIQIMELEGEDNPHPISTARCRLMRMHLEANRPDLARRLWERLEEDTSVWIRYSAALVEFVSWNLLQEKGSTQKKAETLLAQAIRANVFCAYYIAYHDTFRNVMELMEDIEDAEDGTVEQALEYCNSEQMNAWIETEGAVMWIRNFLVRSIKTPIDDGLLSDKDVDWETKLDEEEARTTKDHVQHMHEEGLGKEEPDTLMYTGMFRTAMDMLTDDGAFI
jgi:hypothetical protein